MIKSKWPNFFASTILLILLCPGLPEAYGKKLTPQEIHQQIEDYRTVRREIEKWDQPLPASDPLSHYASESKQSEPRKTPLPVHFGDLEASLTHSRYVFLGDVHSSEHAQENAIRVMTAMTRGGGSEGPVTMVIEWVDSKYQNILEDYLAGKLTLDEVRQGVAYDTNWSFPWSHYSAILAAARDLKIHVLAAEADRAAHELSARDEAITKTLEAHRALNPKTRYLVMYGQNHLMGQQHLTDRLAHRGFEPQLFILQSLAPATYWNILERVADPDRMAVLKFDDRLFYLDSGSPLVTDYEYLRYLSQMAGDEPRIIELGHRLHISDAALDRCARLLLQKQ